MIINRKDKQILYINTMEYDLAKKKWKRKTEDIYNNMGKFYRHYAKQRSQRQGSTYSVNLFIWSFITSKTHRFWKKFSFGTKGQKWPSWGCGNIHYLGRDTDYMAPCICLKFIKLYTKGEKRICIQIQRCIKHGVCP